MWPGENMLNYGSTQLNFSAFGYKKHGLFSHDFVHNKSILYLFEITVKIIGCSLKTSIITLIYVGLMYIRSFSFYTKILYSGERLNWCNDSLPKHLITDFRVQTFYLI